MVATAPPPNPDIKMRDNLNSMHIKDIREELKSYGVDCSSIFEKNELIDALVKARRDDWLRREFEGDDRTTVFDDSSATTGFNEDAFASNDDNIAVAKSTRYTAEDTPSHQDKSWFKQGLEDMASKFNSTLKDTVRTERIKLEMARLKDAKTKELKDELESYGLSTKGYFEKTEFVKAVAEARIDGFKKKKKAGAYASSTNKHSNEEMWDPSYKDVYVTRFDSSAIDPYGIIDV